APWMVGPRRSLAAHPFDVTSPCHDHGASLENQGSHPRKRLLRKIIKFRSRRGESALTFRELIKNCASLNPGLSALIRGQDQFTRSAILYLYIRFFIHRTASKS